MKAWRIEQHGGLEALRIEEMPAPEPGPGEVRLRVRAVGLNHLDLWVRRGVPGHKYPLPLTPGSEISGTVDAIGPGVRAWKPGDRALAAPGMGCGLCEACGSGHEPLCRWYGILGEMRDGGCAEFVLLPERQLLPHPGAAAGAAAGAGVGVGAGLSDEEAAALPLTLLTAWHMLVGRAQLRPGETVLVQAAGSGVGVMGIQIARIFGARVIATAGSAEKAAKAREMGAEETILYRETDLVDEVRRLTAKRGVDVVLESVGGETFEKSIRALAKGGRLVTCGATAGAQAAIDLRYVFFKSLSILGSTMGSRAELLEALRFVEAGKIRPAVDRVFPMEELREAHGYLEDRRAFGKVVMRGFGVGP